MYYYKIDQEVKAFISVDWVAAYENLKTKEKTSR